MLCPKCHKIMTRVRSTVLEDEYCCTSDKCDFSFVRYLNGQKTYNSKSKCSEQEEHKESTVEQG